MNFHRDERPLRGGPVVGLARLLRLIVRGLMTDAREVGTVSRIVRMSILVPIFGGLVVLSRLCAKLGRPIETTAITYDGNTMTCHLADLIPLYIWTFGYWEPDLTAFIQSRLRSGESFIDVGTNIGYYALTASRLVGSEGRVVAIDASPGIYKRLLANIKSNESVANVRCVHAAVSSDCGELTVYAGPYYKLGLTSTIQLGDQPIEATVAAAPLGHLIETDEANSARLIKIDVEGAEDAVLSGIIPLLDQLSDDVEFLVELSPQWWSDEAKTPEDVLRPFREAGFQVYAIENNYWPWRYLWPNVVRPPWRVREPLTERVRRLDLVLSRVDANLLE